MDPDSSTPMESIPCGECHTGKMIRKAVTYYAWTNEELITVPDFPAWVCDICGSSGARALRPHLPRKRPHKPVCLIDLQTKNYYRIEDFIGKGQQRA
jgi:YgiT-type zinc finger domain-containing protein